MFFIAKAQKDYAIISGQIKTTKICFLLLLQETKKQSSLRQRRVCCCYCCCCCRCCCYCCCCCWCRFSDSWDNQWVKKDTQSGISFVFKREQQPTLSKEADATCCLINRLIEVWFNFMAFSLSLSITHSHTHTHTHFPLYTATHTHTLFLSTC